MQQLRSILSVVFTIVNTFKQLHYINQVVDRANENDTIKMPIVGLQTLVEHTRCTELRRFSVPPDGMPCVRDWATCWESMVCGGIDLGREPISVNAVASSFAVRH